MVETRDSRLTSAALHSVFLLLFGGFLALVVFERYQPVNAAVLIRALAVALPVLFLILLWTVHRILRGVELRSPRAWLLAPSLLPWLFALILFANARFDFSAVERQATIVVGKYATTGPRPLFRYELAVRSWREDRGVEGIILRRQEDFDRFRLGAPATVLVRRGLLGLAWIEGVEPGTAPTQKTD